MKLHSVSRFFTVALLGFLLTGCIESTFTINYPENGASYVGTQDNPAPIPDASTESLGNQFEVAFDNSPSSDVQVLLNGHDIAKYFDFGPRSMKGDISKFKQFFRQGNNTLAVDPLGFGPNVIFNLDTAGPEIVISRGEMTGSGAEVEIEGLLRDPSALASTLRLELVQIAGYEVNGSLDRVPQGAHAIPVRQDGTFSACDGDGLKTIHACADTDTDAGVSIPVAGIINAGTTSLLYRFIAEDVYGYQTIKEFLADNDGQGNTLPIKNAVRVAVGDTFIASMRPLIASELHKSLKVMPIDTRIDAWNNPKICNGKKGVVDNQTLTQDEVDAGGTQTACADPVATYDGGKLPDELRDLKVDIGLGNMPTTVERFYLGQNGTMLLSGFKNTANNYLDVDLVITELLVQLSIGMPSWISWMCPAPIEMDMSIKRTLVEALALAYAQNKKVKIELDPDKSDIALQDVSIPSNVKACGLTIPGNIVNPLLGLLEGVIGDMLPGILNPILADNLEKIVIGGRVYREDLIPEGIDKENLPKPDDTGNPLHNQLKDVPQFDLALNVDELGTARKSGDYDLILALESVADVGKADTSIPSILGTLFFDDPIDPNVVYNSDGVTGTNLTVAVNSNLINQSLAAAYSVGTTHMTLYKGTIYNGGNPLTPVDPANTNQTLAKEGDTRVRLWPDGPPSLQFSEVVGGNGAGEAKIVYDSARVYMDSYKDGEWKTTLSLGVNFDLAILINEDAGAVTFGAAGPPVFNINSMVNNTSIQIPPLLIQTVLDAALFMGGDFLAGRYIPLNLGNLARENLNGTEVQYLSSADRYTLGQTECASYDSVDEVWGRCTIGDDSCDPSANALVDGTGGDGYDLICETIEFEVRTDTVGVTGSKGTNLFFQMMARDPAIPPAPAIPRLDLDGDGLLDYRDNCSVPSTTLTAAVASEGGLTFEVVDAEGNGTGLDSDGNPANLDKDGNPLNGFEGRLAAAVNTLLATEFGAERTLAQQLSDWNGLRVNDLAFTEAELGAYPWITMIYANANQYDSDGDNAGELCEDDRDFDGFYADNLPQPVDNCPGTYNPGQADTLYPFGVGDVCNVRSTFVLLRSLRSQDDPAVSSAEPQCITRAGVSSGTPGGVMRVMADCNEADVNQRWYMQFNSAAAGYEFYAGPGRDSNVSRMVNWMQRERDPWDCSNWDHYTDNGDADVKTYLGATTDLLNWRQETGGCVGRQQRRVNPYWTLEAATASTDLDENKHPWVIRSISAYGWNDVEDCLTYSDGFGLDTNPGSCGTTYPFRWALWVGEGKEPWNGQW